MTWLFFPKHDNLIFVPKYLNKGHLLIGHGFNTQEDKTMKRIYKKKEEGVSPVIATILMVAITVVLAATVWLLVSGYTGGSSSTPLTMSLTYDVQQSTGNTSVFDIAMSHPTQVDVTKVKVTVKNGTSLVGTVSISGFDKMIKVGTSGGQNIYVKVFDLNNNTKLDTGDQITLINGGKDSSLGGYTIIVSITGYSGNAKATVPS